MTGEEFIFLSKYASNQTEAQPQPVTDTERKYVYGILGIAKLFGCSLPTANRIKKSGKIDKAVLLYCINYIMFTIEASK